jgi:uncharacterized protein DUF6640
MTGLRAIGRILMTVAALTASVLPIVVDISESHVLNPEWPPHARVHEVWLLSTGAGVGAVALWLIWIRPHLVLSAVLTASILGGFLIAAATAPLYGGVLVDPATAHLMPNNDRVLGIPANLFAFTIALIILLIGLPLARRRHR